MSPEGHHNSPHEPEPIREAEPEFRELTPEQEEDLRSVLKQVGATPQMSSTTESAPDREQLQRELAAAVQAAEELQA